MAKQYKLDIARGVMEASDPSDHALMMEAIKAYKTLHGKLPPLQEAMSIGRSPTPPDVSKRVLAHSKPFSEIVALYLEEKKHDNVAQTLLGKKRTHDDFMALRATWK